MEVSLLAVIRPSVTMRVPDLTLHPGPPLFSRHAKLKGEHLVAVSYELLLVVSRQRLAAAMALFFAQLHGLDAQVMEKAGAGLIRPWLPPDPGHDLRLLRRTWLEHGVPPCRQAPQRHL
jgi:hypothetical protein